MRVSIVLCFLILSLAVAVSAQNERYVKPVDEAKKDASFFAFREKLIAAAKMRAARDGFKKRLRRQRRDRRI
jgi:hypothetical protein